MESRRYACLRLRRWACARNEFLSCSQSIHILALTVSAPMCSIARVVLQCNGCPPSAVPVINKYSTALSVAQSSAGTASVADIASPPHIIVTETADAGLLGEYMLPTLLHAAKILAAPSAVHSARAASLIPASAVVHAALVHDESLLRMSQAHFFSSQLRSDEAYSCGKLPESATVLTPSFVGELRIACSDIFPTLFRPHFTVCSHGHRIWPRYCRETASGYLCLLAFELDQSIVQFVLVFRRMSSATLADPRAAYWCGGPCTLHREFP
jgi:hypothetical protein